MAARLSACRWLVGRGNGEPPLPRIVHGENGTFNRTKQEARPGDQEEAGARKGEVGREANPQKLPSSFSSTELDCLASYYSLLVLLLLWTWPMHHAREYNVHGFPLS
jgi:hypothetical protein